MIYDNTKIKNLVRQELELKIAKLTSLPSLDIVMIGDNLPGQKYVSIKQKIGKTLGIQVNLHTDKNQIPKILKTQNGLIFQLPLPQDCWHFLDQISLISDVDLLGNYRDILWQKQILPPTIRAIDMVLKDMLGLDIWKQADFGGLNIAIVGQGKMVGSDLLRLLKDQNATIFSFNKDSQNISQMLGFADVVISAVGVPNLVDTNWLKPNCKVIDAATCEANNVLVGDIQMDNLREDILICTSPKGVGSLTVLNLFWNLVMLQKITKF
jgi:methylenetetrahydrofolate dehydrogenase (NADP+) / methenyltetrahydrofolate cyclohydrolase